jgi:hypothetical protein
LKFCENLSQWWCHADDDTYFNIKELYKLLSNYDATKPWYLGKISTSQPMTVIVDKVNLKIKLIHGKIICFDLLGLSIFFVRYWWCWVLYFIRFSNKNDSNDEVYS